MPDRPNFFKDRRDELGMTQREIALRLEMTVQAVSAWETGKTAPQAKLAPKLAEIYKVSETRMYREIGELSSSIAQGKEAAAAK